MTFSYLDKIRLRMLYDWQSKHKQSLPETILEIAKEYERILKEEEKYKKDQRATQIQKKFDEIIEEPAEDGVQRNFAAKYAIIYANEHYDKLRTIEEMQKMDNL